MKVKVWAEWPLRLEHKRPGTREIKVHDQIRVFLGSEDCAKRDDRTAIAKCPFMWLLLSYQGCDGPKSSFSTKLKSLTNLQTGHHWAYIVPLFSEWVCLIWQPSTPLKCYRTFLYKTKNKNQKTLGLKFPLWKYFHLFFNFFTNYRPIQVFHFSLGQFSYIKFFPKNMPISKSLA